MKMILWVLSKGSKRALQAINILDLLSNLPTIINYNTFVVPSKLLHLLLLLLSLPINSLTSNFNFPCDSVWLSFKKMEWTFYCFILQEDQKCFVSQETLLNFAF